MPHAPLMTPVYRWGHTGCLNGLSPGPGQDTYAANFRSSYTMPVADEIASPPPISFRDSADDM